MAYTLEDLRKGVRCKACGIVRMRGDEKLCCKTPGFRLNQGKPMPIKEEDMFRELTREEKKECREIREMMQSALPTRALTGTSYDPRTPVDPYKPAWDSLESFGEHVRKLAVAMNPDIRVTVDRVRDKIAILHYYVAWCTLGPITVEFSMPELETNVNPEDMTIVGSLRTLLADVGATYRTNGKHVWPKKK